MTAPYLPQRKLLTTPDLAGVDNVLPVFPGQRFLAKKEAVWSTEVIKSRSGRRWTAANWSYPVWRWELPFDFLRRQAGRDEMGRLYAFFNRLQGQAGEFLYLDRDDNAVVDQLVGTGNGSTTMFQLVRTTEGWTEPVFALNGEPIVKVGGVQTSALAVDERGLLTLTTPPPADVPVTWTGSYYFRCAMSSDSLSPAQICRSFWSLSSLAFESVKP